MPIFNEKFFENNQKYNSLANIKLAGVLLDDSNYYIARENSSTCILGYILKGVCYIKSNKKAIILTQGDSFLIPNNWNYTQQSSKENPLSMLWVNLEGDLIVNFCKTIFKNNFSYAPYNAENEMNVLMKLLESRTSNLPEISSLLLKILLNINNYKVEKTQQPVADFNKTLKKYVENHLQIKFDVVKMAKDFSMSESTLIRTFKREFNTTPYSYYQSIRIEIAKSLLLNTNLTIDDIAFKLNFNNRNHFTSYFIQKTNCSPGKFRRNSNLK